MLAVGFLSTRVSRCTIQDQLKLKRLLEYLNVTHEKVLSLGADSMHLMLTWVDASYATHTDMKSHMGEAILFGQGTIMNKPNKQKLNTKSLTEAKLVGASNFFTNTIWAKVFHLMWRPSQQPSSFFPLTIQCTNENNDESLGLTATY